MTEAKTTNQRSTSHPPLPIELWPIILSYTAINLSQLCYLSTLCTQIRKLTWLSPSFIAQFILHLPLQQSQDWNDRLHSLVKSEYTWESGRNYITKSLIPDHKLTWLHLASSKSFTPSVCMPAISIYVCQHSEGWMPSLEVLERLCERGFRVPQSALLHACTLGSVEVVNLLIERSTLEMRRGDNAQKGAKAKRMITSPTAHSAVLNYNSHIRPMLMEIIPNGHVPLLKNMFTHHAFTWTHLGQLGSSLYMAVTLALSAGHTEMVSYIISNTRSYDWGDHVRVSLCTSFLLNAVSEGRVDMVKFIVEELGGDVGRFRARTEEHGKTLLHYVPCYSMLEYLWEKGGYESVD
ncbi:hypothetical protein HDV05_001410, partial [Chytridiales sp. JEL 0842]